MSDHKPRAYTANQQKIIKRYYDNIGAIKTQRLADLAGELYLASEKKKVKLWQQAAEAMALLKVPQSRIDQLLKHKNPALLAELVQELDAKK